jgi:Inward rectifier potassium channel C-terminal domain
MILIRNIITAEGDEVRRFRSLKLEFDHLIAFPAVLTVRHRMDEESPLFGMTPEDFQQQDIRIIASIVGVDTVIVAPVQSCGEMYPQYNRLSVPTWIIGPALGEGPLIDRPADMLKVWPRREPIQRLPPA